MSAAKLWTRHWVPGHKCMLQEMGPGESEYAGKGFSGGKAQFKRKIHLGISSTCVLIHAPQLLKKVKQGFETRKWGRLYKRVWCALEDSLSHGPSLKLFLPRGARGWHAWCVGARGVKENWGLAGLQSQFLERMGNWREGGRSDLGHESWLVGVGQCLVQAESKDAGHGCCGHALRRLPKWCHGWEVGRRVGLSLSLPQAEHIYFELLYIGHVR